MEDERNKHLHPYSIGGCANHAQPTPMTQLHDAPTVTGTGHSSDPMDKVMDDIIEAMGKPKKGNGGGLRRQQGGYNDVGN